MPRNGKNVEWKKRYRNNKIADYETIMKGAGAKFNNTHKLTKKIVLDRAPQREGNRQQQIFVVG